MTISNLLNINQSKEELDKIHGEDDYYWYLRSPEFRDTFLKGIAEIVDYLGDPCLDVGCGEACLADYVRVSYTGMDGSREAIEKAIKRLSITRRAEDPISLYIARIENGLGFDASFGTVIFGGILEVLIKPEHRVSLLQYYQKAYKVNHFVIFDLERLDTSKIEECYGKPITELHLVCPPIYNKLNSKSISIPIPEVKLRRKVLVYKCQS